MKPRELLPDETVDFFYKWLTTLRQLEEPLKIMLDEGFPVREHWQRLQEHKQWADQMIRVFDLVT